MILHTEISYVIYDNDNPYKSGTIGIVHSKNLNNSAVKRFLRKSLAKEKKDFRICVVAKEAISEEVAFQRYGNNLVHIPSK